MTKQFVGPNEVLGSSILGEKLVDGSDLVEVLYTDNTKQVLTKKMFEAVVKEEATDLTTLRNNRLTPVVKECLTSMLLWGIKMSEVNFLISMITTSTNENFNQASDLQWGKKFNEVTFVDIDKILRIPIDQKGNDNQGSQDTPPPPPISPAIISPEV